jgi:uncharacterized membrane protein YgdD (TMEM256/DUF423 family)
MPDSFLILLAGGIMLAAAVSDPRAVTLNWLRLAGILALSMAGLAAFFFVRRDEPKLPGQWVAIGLTLAAVLGQLAFVQVASRGIQRALAAVAFLGAAAAGVVLFPRYGVERQELWRRASAAAACAGVASATGLALMDMLLGHAYLTAAKMTIAPFRRLNLALAAALGFRAACGFAAVLLARRYDPVEMLWPRFGLQIGTRWLVGLVVPAAFVYMAHDCIRRRSTQSATGILYVAGVLIFIGELTALWLARETGLPW